MKWIHGVLLLLASGIVFAQTSEFSATANGTPQDVPTDVANDLRKDQGRVEVTIVPNQITTGSQHFFRSDEWGFWLWTDELHGQFHMPDGTRKLIRLRDADGDPLPGSGGVANQPLTFELSWSPAGLGVFVDGQLRVYLEGQYNLPGDRIIYGASPGPNAGNPYNGSISVKVFADPLVYDPCSNHPNWAMVQTFSPSGQSINNVVPPLPTCQTVPDPTDDPILVVDGEAIATFSWNAPTQNEDGSALAIDDIKEYRIFWDRQSRIARCTAGPDSPTDAACYGNMLTIPSGTVTSQPLTLNLDENATLYFSMITVVDDEDGNPLVSKWSNEVARTFQIAVIEPEPEPEPVPTPEAPTSVEVTLQLTCTTNVPGVTCEITVQDP